jgi:demethylmenaquinone methyltransferase/2-methoxy-6-polyprenyl-1,4-benzoquinol methylase
MWTDENLANPHATADKARRVQAMFGAIAGSYDRNNRLHSLGRDQAWRRAAAAAAEPRPTDVVLDVACGTGDLALAFARRGVARVLGVDFTLPMLEIARTKSPPAGAGLPGGPRLPGVPGVIYLAGDALALPIADAAVDIVSIAFGIRNVTDVPAALREFYRVLRPGGRLVILEFSQPSNRLLRALYNSYFHHVLPHTATWIARDRTGAYKYLPRSVSTFMDRQTMQALLTQTGFTQPTQHPLTLGIAVIYRAVKPAAARGDLKFQI